MSKLYILICRYSEKKCHIRASLLSMRINNNIIPEYADIDFGIIYF